MPFLDRVRGVDTSFDTSILQSRLAIAVCFVGLKVETRVSTLLQSKPPRSRRKVPQPYTDFPLFAHDSGRWAKKIRGKLYYFGYWARRENGKLKRLPGETWREALAQYEQQRDNLCAGRKPRKLAPDGPTIRELCNRFLTAKQHQVERVSDQRLRAV
jgi:hypothetical protein